MKEYRSNVIYDIEPYKSSRFYLIIDIISKSKDVCYIFTINIGDRCFNYLCDMLDDRSIKYEAEVDEDYPLDILGKGLMEIKLSKEL